jgi:ribosomal protein L11 methyltransferase
VATPRIVVRLEVDSSLSELAADALWQARPSAVLEVELADGRVRLTADVADAGAIDPAWHPVLLLVDDDSYLDAWRTWALPVRAGRRIVLQPAWVPREDEPAGDDLVVVLDPGRAFGSGSHESTRLAVAALEDVVVAGDRVLDVGCGCGVLAIVACLLGAAEALGIDVDAQAVPATEANAAANGVGPRVRVRLAPLAQVDGAFDVVAANIGGRVLFDLAGELVAHLRPGGRLVLSGILDDQVDALVAACTGCLERSRASEGGWASVVLSRR